MDTNFSPSPSAAHPETMDFLSKAWCNFAVQALQPADQLQDRSIVLLDPLSNNLFDNNTNNIISSCSFLKMDKSLKMEAEDFRPLPPWKSNDVNSWIWMQQAMHPELNYNSYLKKKWFQWKIVPLKNVSIKKWLKEIRQRRKEEDRLERAEVHAAISVAGIAAALAAIAADQSSKNKGESNHGTESCNYDQKEAAVAAAAALVAAQCAKMAEAMGAKREQLSNVIGSAMTSTSATDILTLTAAASTSLKGAATLKARTGHKNMNRLNGVVPVLPIEDNFDADFNFKKCRSILANGTRLRLQTPSGKHKVRLVSITQNGEAKVILKTRKVNLLKTKKESVVLDMHVELYKDDEEDDNEEESDTCYLLALRTSRGTLKLDMADNYERYKTWSITINHMLLLSTSFTKYI